MIPYSDAIKIYGPYKAKDNRLRVIVRYSSGATRTVSYPKYLCELHLGRYLEANETVDHIDRDPLNNELDNLRIIDRIEHAKQDALINVVVPMLCDVCGTVFVPNTNQVKDRKRKNHVKSGPYCSRRCAGIDSHNKVRQRKKLVVDKVVVKSLAAEKLQGMGSNSVNPVISGNTERSSQENV